MTSIFWICVAIMACAPFVPLTIKALKGEGSGDKNGLKAQIVHLKALVALQKHTIDQQHAIIEEQKQIIDQSK